MEQYCAVFALLPLGLFSLLSRGRSSDAGFGWFAALAPVVAKGLGSLFGAKSKQAEERKQADFERQQAAAKEAADKAAWEAQQNSPAAIAARQKYTLQLGRLAGALGGMDKLPPSIANALQQQRKMPEYVPGMGYIERPKSGSGWDLASGIGEALSYFDYNKLKGGGKAPVSDSRGIAVGQNIGGASSPSFKPGQAVPLGGTNYLANLSKYSPLDPNFQRFLNNEQTILK